MFRPLELADLDQLHAWFNAPHARRWFQGGRPLDDVVKEYAPAILGEVPIRAYMLVDDGRPIGLMEWVRCGDFPQMAELYGVTDPDTANCDVLIGESDHAHRGKGPALIRAFLEQVVFADPRVTGVAIDPESDNMIAIRAYEKAGFRFVRAVPEDGEGNSVYLMELSRQGFAREPEREEIEIRPARPHEIQTAVAIDDDACEAYRAVGLPFDHPSDHPFSLAERARWVASARDARLLFACAGKEPVGFAALDHVDGRPHLAQLSVRRTFMRRGIGRALLLRALRWAVRPGELWLTTYDHVPWNAPWYARMGFETVLSSDAPKELQSLLASAREVLPSATNQVAMVCRGKRFSDHMRRDVAG